MRKFPSRYVAPSALKIICAAIVPGALPLAITFHAFRVKKPLGTEPGAVATGSWTQLEWRDPVATALGSVTGSLIEHPYSAVATGS